MLAALAVLASCWFAGAQGAAAATRSFAMPGDHPYTVPAGVTSITVTAVGAAGGNCTPAHGGRGASITATVPVTPGEALVVGVAGAGGPCNGTAPGGFGGGGAGGQGTPIGGPGAGGGGASVVAPGTSSPEWGQALLVAGGGGGSTDFKAGINGGDAGSPGDDGTVAGSGGGAGTQSAGGVGGVPGDAGAQSGFSGSLGAGGAGGDGDMAADSNAIGGGGGGGYYGGGGGGGAGTGNHDSGSGGGGSSYVTAGATNVSGPTPTSGAPEVTIAPNFTVAPAVEIVHAKISNRLHAARFAFKSVGEAAGFQCALVKHAKHQRQPRASFSSCHSPKRYAHLKPGKYTFEVRSVSAGVYGTAAQRRFAIA